MVLCAPKGQLATSPGQRPGCWCEPILRPERAISHVVIALSIMMIRLLLQKTVLIYLGGDMGGEGFLGLAQIAYEARVFRIGTVDVHLLLS